MLEDQDRLFRDTLQNVHSSYFGGDFNSWRTRNCAVLLDSSQFCPISQLSPGVVSPCQISLRVDFQNECVYADGLGPVSGLAAATGLFGNAAAAPSEVALSADYIRSRPVVVAFFQRSVLSIAPSSAVVSVQSFSAQAAQEVLAANR